MTSPLIYGNVRMVDVVDGIAILEQVRARVSARRDPPTKAAPTAFLVDVLPHVRYVKVAEVAQIYEEALEKENATWSSAAGQVQYAFLGSSIRLTVTRLTPYAAGTPEGAANFLDNMGDWAAPSVVGAVARAALEEAAVYLVLRRAGNNVRSENWIPYMVGYLLVNEFLTYTETSDRVNRKEIQRLLNEHVYGEIPWKRLPSDPSSNMSKINQFWNGVWKVAQIDNVFWPPPVPVDVY